MGAGLVVGGPENLVPLSELEELIGKIDERISELEEMLGRTRNPMIQHKTEELHRVATQLESIVRRYNPP